MLVEIVSHCYSGSGAQYARLLRYQLQSVAQHRPERIVDLANGYPINVRASSASRTCSLLTSTRPPLRLSATPRRSF